MSAIYHICRRARREDIRKTMNLWQQDEPLYDADVWRSLPALLEDLVERDLVSFAIIESGPGREPRMLGGISFVRPEYIADARSGRSTLPNLIMRAALRKRSPFLSPKEVAIENARGALNLMNFFGVFDVVDLMNPELASFYRTSNEGYRFFHFGYSFRSMWFDIWAPHHVEELQKQGMRTDRQLLLPSGKTSTLMRLTAEDALANPYARYSGYFFPPKPRFRFSFGEQRLLEYALLESSDEEAAKELHLSEDAIKKRWRSIYGKVEKTDPDLLVAADSGAARRRTLLRYLRQNLAELRPYREQAT
jgi:hypothetical protein